MGKKLVSVNLRGKSGTWGIETYATPEDVAAWRADGLDVIVVENVVPEWIAAAGLAGPWCFLQDVFNFKNPWRR